MRKFLLLLMMITISVVLVACGGGDDEDTDDETEESEDTETTDEESTDEDADSEEDSDADSDSDSDSDAESDSDSDSEESDSEESTDEESSDSETEEIETEEAVDGNEIDVLSSEFIDVFFGGPEAYQYNSIPEGSTQEDVEEMYGTHELLFDSNGTELAVYGNLAVEYSGGSAYFEGNEVADVESAADNTVENVYIYAGVTTNDLMNSYGPPTLQYDQFMPEEGQTPYMIFDGTRDNDYAVYAEVISVHRDANGEEMAAEVPIVSVLYKAEELETLPEPLY
ncbi:MAG TPA: hypothetical protein K8V35_00115 [Aliicoccus persicus]|uniref:Uncharacterized protein n=1 Tax=Aliicoccus persicus TaxID=930138 RepID=A0A921B5S6_9STAP|nr:hypothetical protein [Aliicoccus persicus]